MDCDSKRRKQTFVNYVLEKLKTRLKEKPTEPHNYKRCEYKYEANVAEDELQNDIKDDIIDNTTNETNVPSKKKKVSAKCYERIYQASLPIEGLEVTREISESCESDSTNNSNNIEPKKRQRKRKRRHRARKDEEKITENISEVPTPIIPIPDGYLRTTEDIEVPAPIPAPDSAQSEKSEEKVTRKKNNKEAKIASVRVDLKNEAHSLAQVWNDFFKARFTLVTEPENIGDDLPETCNRIPINTGCQVGDTDSKAASVSNELYSESTSCTDQPSNVKQLESLTESTSLTQSSSVDVVIDQNVEPSTTKICFEERYKELEESGSSCEEDEQRTTEVKKTKPKDNAVKLTKNQRRKLRKKKRKFYQRKEKAERQVFDEEKLKELSLKRFEKSKDEIIAFFDSMWDIFQQENKDKLGFDELERLRVILIQVFDDIQHYQQTTPTFEMLVSIKKWLLLLDNHRARAVLDSFQQSEALPDHKQVITSLVEYWIIDIAPSLGGQSST
ncbi:uncharacterized protein [Antedon mediterranea]|uniref:uncharacterized protein n=1 Tax=Antedon mediterranea TaxID=105859 RepID=UPI003AF9ABDD